MNNILLQSDYVQTPEFIAQDMINVCPEAVNGSVNSDSIMSMDYGRITPVIVAALQEALKEIEVLKKKVSDLENK